MTSHDILPHSLSRQVADLLSEHRHLLNSSAQVPQQVHCLNEIAQNLVSLGHFAGQAILNRVSRLLLAKWRSLSQCIGTFSLYIRADICYCPGVLIAQGGREKGF